MTRLIYQLYAPTIEAQAPYPLIIFLHGVGERGNDLDLVKKWGLPHYTETGEVQLPAYIAVPQCPADLRWKDVLDELDAMLDELLANHPLDSQRVLLTGFSMGGFGTWSWAAKRPERFAALMPVGGTVLPKLADLRRLQVKPIWIVHSALDQSVSIRGADHVALTFPALGGTLGYTRYPDADHGETADRAFRDTTILNWLLEQKLDS